MIKVKTFSILTLIFSVISLFALIISHLALTDIYHNDEDLVLEWNVLRVSAIVFLTFIILTTITLMKVLKNK